MRLIQHKKEAFYFYHFLSIFYDKYVNPFFWTESMREEALKSARLDRPGLLTIDVGSGTGFNTLGIVENIDPRYITCVDQSPHQMAKARQKAELSGCSFILSDAENLPVATDHFDRYISAGSIEYWPDPLKGIAEAYRVIKPGGIALIIGPLKPQNRIARFFAEVWMLFPEEDEYISWFKQAGFIDISTRLVAPDWISKEKYGIAIAGTKPQGGESPAAGQKCGGKTENDPLTISRKIRLLGRLIPGSLAGFVFIPLAVLVVMANRLGLRKSARKPLPLTFHQKLISLLILALLAVFILWIFL
ncbi:MAG: methyltransferase domain-containing protein [Calditrichia bacterium]